MRTLVTGASGAVGRRLTEALADAGHDVVAATRRPMAYDGPGTAVAFDLDTDLDLNVLDQADAAYYLVHALDRRDFADVDRRRAERFASKWGTDRPLVYLGGLGDPRSDLRSPHLRSRHEVGQILRKGCAAIEMQASLVIGADSLSFRLLRTLGGLAGLSLLPVVVPRAATTLTQPIGQADLTAALVGALDLRPGSYQIGGPDVVSFGELLERSARAQGRPLRIWPVLPVGTEWLGPAAALIASADPWATTALFGSMHVETIVDAGHLPPGLARPATTLDQALATALG